MVVPAGILQRVEARLTGIIEGDQLAVDRGAELKCLLEGRKYLRKLAGEILPVSREQMHTALVSNRLSAVSIELELAHPARAIGKIVDWQTFHRRGERNVVMVARSHPNRGNIEPVSSVFRGSMRLGLSFRVFPTALPTFHAFISSAG